MNAFVPFDVAARRFRVWIGSIVVFLVVALATAPAAKRTVENVVPILGLNLVLLFLCWRLARRVGLGRGIMGALTLVVLYALLGTVVMAVSLGFGPRENYPFVVAVWLLVVVCALRAIVALVRCLDADTPREDPGDSPDSGATRR